jgi:hypothetical protein
LEGYLGLLKETLRRVKILTHLGLRFSAEVQCFKIFVETLSSWVLINAGNWLLTTFEDLFQTSQTYPEFSERLSATKLIEVSIKLGLIPQDTRDQVTEIDKAGRPKPRVGTDGRRSPCQTCLLFYMGADMEHPSFAKDQGLPGSTEDGSGPSSGVGVMMVDWNQMHRGPKMISTLTKGLPEMDYEEWDRSRLKISISRDEMSKVFGGNSSDVPTEAEIQYTLELK